MTRTLTLVIATLLATPTFAFDLPNLTFPPADAVTPSTQGTVPAPKK
ncbi:MAG: hypothetical protein ACRC14_13695 [Paracoccaceae bacterium]